MKLVHVEFEGRPTWGIIEQDTVHRAEGDIYGSPKKGAPIGPLASLKILTPVVTENTVYVLQDNWFDRERDGPGFIVKPLNTRCNPGDTVIYPKLATQVWIEAELAVVIGRRCKNVSVEQARDHILGYTASLDATAAEWTKKLNFHLLTGKGFDTFCMLGPCIETDLDPTNATLRGFINGEQYFEKNTGEMLWNAYEVVSWMSQVATLMPGDVISMGACMETLSRFMEPGQLVGIAIDGIGKFEFPVRAE